MHVLHEILHNIDIMDVSVTNRKAYMLLSSLSKSYFGYLLLKLEVL